MSELELRTLTAVLDEIIPPDSARGLPGAGELGLAEHVLSRVGEPPPGLGALTAGGFADLPISDRTPALREYAEKDPGFIPGLVFHTYTAYYRDPSVIRALGGEPGPPYPRGYELEPFDLNLLAPVQAQPKRYRTPE